MKRLAPILLILFLVLTSGVASATESREVPKEDLVSQMEPAMEPAGIDWMGIWVSYWWVVVIVIGAAAGLGLSFIFTRGLP